MRRHARFGYYGLPLRECWSRDEDWRKRSLAMVELLRHADRVGPSIYQLYKTGDQRPREQQDGYAEGMTRMGLEAAEAAGGKPVYVWINHRYHASNRTYGNQRVPLEESRENLEAIMGARYEGRGSDGIIWWAADLYYLRRGELPADEKRPQIDAGNERFFAHLATVLGRTPREP